MDINELNFCINEFSKDLSLEEQDAVQKFFAQISFEEPATYDEYLNKTPISFYFKIIRHAVDLTYLDWAIEEMRTNPSMQEVEDRY